MQHLASGPRLPFTAAYFGSIGLTLYFSLGVSKHHSRYLGFGSKSTNRLAAPKHNPDAVRGHHPACLLGMVYGELLPHGLQRAAPGYQLRHEKSYGVDVGLRAPGTASHSLASSSQFQHESWPRPLESIRQHVPPLQSVWVCSRLILMFVYEIAKFEIQFSSTQWAGNHYPSLNFFILFSCCLVPRNSQLECPVASLESRIKHEIVRWANWDLLYRRASAKGVPNR